MSYNLLLLLPVGPLPPSVPVHDHNDNSPVTILTTQRAHQQQQYKSIDDVPLSPTRHADTAEMNKYLNNYNQTLNT